ncbi:MAG: hypothetical protein OXG74_00575 [Acidobacteria bacterium]|nr:hypothetical protein [Acidobacteriota bacterium]
MEAEQVLAGRRPLNRLILAASLLTLGALLIHAREYQFLTDDAYISFRYARNLADGHGLVFNPGFERVEGYTNLLWVLILAAGALAGIAPEAASIALGYGLTILLWLLVCRFAYSEARPRDPPWIWLLAPVMLAATRSVAVWSTSGLETRLFEVLILGALLRLSVEIRGAAAAPATRASTTDAAGGRVAHRPWASLLFALATLTRPDGALIAGCSLSMAWIWLAFRRRRQQLYPECLRIDLRRAAQDAFVYAVPVGASVGFRLAYYGEWLPNTYYAKVGGLSWWSMGWDYAQSFVIEYAMWLWLPLLVAGCWRSFRCRRERGVIPLLFASAAVPHAVYYVSIGGDHFEYRPFDLYFPLAFLVMAGGAAELLPRRGQGRSREPGVLVLARRSAVIGLLFVVLYGTTRLPVELHRALAHLEPRWLTMEEFAAHVEAGLGSDSRLRRHYVSLIERTHRSVVGVRAEIHDLYLELSLENARVVQDLVATGRLPADTHVALGSVGVVPYLSNLRTFDYLGLTDRDVARNPPRVQEPRQMAHDRMASFDQARAAGVELWNPLIQHRTWLDREIAVVRQAAADSPLIYAMVGDDQALVATPLHDMATIRTRFPRLDFERIDRGVQATIEREFDYTLSLAPDGRVSALMRRPLDVPSAEPMRIPVRNTERVQGFVDAVTVPSASGAADPLARMNVRGWAFGKAAGRIRDVVVFAGGIQTPYERVDLTERQDVSATLGPEARNSGWFVSTSVDVEVVEQQGLVVFAVFRDDRAEGSVAKRLDVHHWPLSDGQGEARVLHISDGRKLPVRRPGAELAGAVEELAAATGGYLLSGWAADVANGAPPHGIVVYRDGVFLKSAGLGVRRFDVADRFGDTGLRQTGFRLTLPDVQPRSGAADLRSLSDADRAAFVRRHRVFALLDRGAALELPLR